MRWKQRSPTPPQCPVTFSGEATGGSSFTRRSILGDVLKRALSQDEVNTALAAAEILINECTGIKHQEEGPEAAEAFEREALTALAETLAQGEQTTRCDQ